MSRRMLENVLAGFEELRHEPRRVVPSHAVPVADVRAELIPATRANGHVADGLRDGRRGVPRAARPRPVDPVRRPHRR